MNLTTYILGSLYIMRSVFRFSNYLTNYLYKNDIINLPLTKFDKINECIYSSIHGVLVSLIAVIADDKSIRLQYLASSLCFSYFTIDLIHCIYYKKYLFILHHLAALNLLLVSFYLYYNKQNTENYTMDMIFLLESNTVLLNIGFLLKEFNFHYSITCLAWIIHLCFFIIFRIIMIPKILIVYYYNESFNVITLSQLPSFGMILSGSVYWAYRQAIGINKYLKENSVI